jgi:hypothetical protein
MFLEFLEAKKKRKEVWTKLHNLSELREDS